MEKPENNEKIGIMYYIYLDYSEKLVGYTIIEKGQIPHILSLISKLHHYKDIKNKKAYIKSIKKVFANKKIEQYLLKCRIKELKDNLSIFVEILDFVKKHDDCSIFMSIDNNQYVAFIKLFGMIPHKDNVKIVMESDLKKGSVEYKLSLIIQN